MEMKDRYGDVIKVTKEGAIVSVEFFATSTDGEAVMSLEPHQLDEFIHMLQQIKNNKMD